MLVFSYAAVVFIKSIIFFQDKIYFFGINLNQAIITKLMTFIDIKF